MLSSKASAEPGRWRTSRTPYLRAIMDCLSPASPVERVVFMKGAQVGATESGSCWMGYVIHYAPGPMMVVWPTVEMAKRNSKQRIDPLIEESPVLKELISPARSRDSGNTILAKEFRGGVLVMTGANSAVGLRSLPVRNLFLDEVGDSHEARADAALTAYRGAQGPAGRGRQPRCWPARAGPSRSGPSWRLRCAGGFRATRLPRGGVREGVPGLCRIRRGEWRGVVEWARSS
jgi:hypothetical protein